MHCKNFEAPIGFFAFAAARGTIPSEEKKRDPFLLKASRTRGAVGVRPSSLKKQTVEPEDLQFTSSKKRPERAEDLDEQLQDPVELEVLEAQPKRSD